MPVYPGQGQGQNRRKRAERVAWLRAHPELWTRAPADYEDADVDASTALRTLGETMVAEDLYSRWTLKNGDFWGLRILIGELKRERML